MLPAVSVYAVQIRGASFAVGSSQYRDVQMDKALRIRGCLVHELPGFTTQHQLELSRRELQFRTGPYQIALWAILQVVFSID